MSGSEHGGNSNERRDVKSPDHVYGVRSASPAKRSAADMEDIRLDASRAREQTQQPAPANVGFAPTRDAASTDLDEPMAGMTPAMHTDTDETAANSTAPTQLGTLTTNTSAASSHSDAPPPYEESNAVRKDTQYTTAEIDAQVGKVREAWSKGPDVGEKGVVVSCRWLGRVLSRTSDGLRSNDFTKGMREGPIGLIDNSDIVPEGAFDPPFLADPEDPKGNFIPLKPGLSMDQDYQVLPDSSWGYVVSCYGMAPGQKQINRYAKNTAGQDAATTNIQYEMYPPTITIRKVPQPTQEEQQAATPDKSNAEKAARRQQMQRQGQRSESDAPKLVTARSSKMQDFLVRAKEAAGIPRNTQVRVWRLLNAQKVAVEAPDHHEAGVLSPPRSPDISASKSARDTKNVLVLPEADFKAMEVGRDLEHVDVKDQTMNNKYNGNSTVDIYGLHEDTVLLLEEQIGGPAGGEFQSDNKKRTKFSLLNSNSSRPGSAPASGRASPQPGGMITRGRARRDGRTRGTVGLSNLGNTCYMNSALQCIRSVEELAIYFLADRYKAEINSNNPLGHGGVMAKKYAGVLNGIYGDNSSSTFSPSDFKRTLGSLQPLFSGYGQQDSQEFLSFLVDALHEDLNRIQKKPYTENPDSDDKTVRDPQAIIELGEVYRKNHRARNDSVCMDLFSGFYKNTMECPVCEKVSITFDPYSLVTVQLPIESSFQHTVTFVPLNGPPVNHAIDTDRNSTIKALKQSIASKHSGVSADRLWMAEVYGQRIYKVFENHQTLAELSIQGHDYIFAFELEDVPTNISDRAPRKAFSHGSDKIPDMDDPKAERMAVPVFSRQRSRFGNTWEITLHPLYILLTREEAKDFEVILKKLLIAVSKQTSRPILTEFDDSDQVGEPTVNGESEKEESAGEDVAQVSDRSVPSEDGYVEVSLDNAREDGQSEQVTSAPEPPPKATPIPAHFMSRDYSIAEELRNHLFAVNYAKSDGGMSCASMQSFVEKTVSNMYSRVKQPPRRPSVQSTSEESTTSVAAGHAECEVEESDADDDNDKPDIVIGQEDALHMPTPTSANPDSGSDFLPDDPIEGRGGRRRVQGKQDKFRRKRKPRQKTYGRADRRNTQNRPDSSGSLTSTQSKGTLNGHADNDDEQYYIKLGEAIVLDWYPDGLNDLFGGDPEAENQKRGYWLSSRDGRDLDFVPDPVLQAKKQQRAERRKHGVTLEDCFVETGKREILSEDNAWYCNRCKEMRQAAKTLEIWTIPDILIVHLKRFGGNRSFRDKIDVMVDYPIDGLDMTEKIGLKEDGKEYIYDLFAVDNHYGGLGGGHYTALAKNFYDGQWYDYNDSICSKAGDAKLRSAAAYLLFYRRRSDKPLGPQYLQNLIMDARNPQPTDVTAEDDDEDESGEAKLGGPTSSLHGSSSALHAAGAGTNGIHLSHGGGGAGARADSSLTTKTSLANSSDGSNVPRQFGSQGGDWGFQGLDEVPDTGLDAEPSTALLNQTGHAYDDEDNLSTTAEHDSAMGGDDSGFRSSMEEDPVYGPDMNPLLGRDDDYDMRSPPPLESIEQEHDFYDDHGMYSNANERPSEPSNFDELHANAYDAEVSHVENADAESPPAHDIRLEAEDGHKKME
ncbi:hypothetical protein BAUCODRAFT_120356 [Baudoinia panamericana UAMH 10762]|uniref:ubiquitinyl hydrolase 1 n=1 Tax=Baudoinia panamericana (strain UAMH 10762) TaxID=717646 RepID=M2NI79_BAUPA|nr:uncharacterized protein BAUCODRAFT_120356 [Baudoinia panamericana UAMH 10762]EMC99064.1 hypothetical protein BAUCODRAFT_120356 [Baudoinia panamericana UAMH 10762]